MKVFYITGSPGVGKSAVASNLADKVNAKILNLGEISKVKDFSSGYDRRRKCAIVNIKKLEKFVQNFIVKSDKNVIIDGHFMIKLPKKLLSFIFVLRCEPEELEKRLRKKGYSERKILENVWAEILDSCLIEAVNLYGSERIHEVNTTNKTVAEVVNEIVNVINQKRKPVLCLCNWLDKIKVDQLIKLSRVERRS
jgi:adenylate kinase